ncbi:MAG: tetratricopeptide repeat protein [Candidatus Hydrogenedentes bacterium]|nr:tetratricopeptide repeat protein [Candidatus Hydrogenedentota bacterium]
MNCPPGANHHDARTTRRCVMLSVALFMVTVLAYLPALRADFVTYDDGLYVTENEHVQQGLTVDSVVWAFTNGKSGSWQPLTWLSHMLDYEVFGDAARGHHLSNVLLHGAASVLIFLALLRMTRDAAPSLFVAAVFALHPLHVESVAWVSERKDVLSAFFAMLTILAYARYARTSSRGPYVLSLVWLSLGLMAKPMLVTVPGVLLLLDYWPLKRCREPVVRTGARLFLEKLPHFGLAFAFALVTLWMQRDVSAMSSLEALPLDLRIRNAVYSYAAYAGKTFWPVHLAAYYPHPRESLTWLTVGFAGTLLLAVTAVVLLLRKRAAYLPVGWFWYLGMLVPVIGIIQAGTQGMADRYMYLPMVGLTIMVAWGVAELASKVAAPPWAPRVAGVAVAAALACCTGVQAGYWRDSETLFRRALAVTENNEVAERALATVLIDGGRDAEALPHLLRAIELDPGFAENHYHLGIIRQREGDHAAAIIAFNRAIELDPGYSQAYNNLGVTLMNLGRYSEAERAIAKAVETDSANREAVENYAGVLVAVGNYTEAESRLRPLLEESPDDAVLHTNLAAALLGQGKLDEARKHFVRALEIQPDYEPARRGLEALEGR